MKMLFFSTDRDEVEFVRQNLVDAGIVCEIHDRGVITGLSLRPSDAELWVLRDREYYRAALVCAELNIGFARRAVPPEDLAA